ncbi:hypothetical protein ACFSSC_10140 [Corynebacterium mendelii]|uniref:Uncharacterized protein n=1 Tax=Corynebacterium mendelii TaxID=2765362 RepID=A0A939E2P2_9CORY|nr:hypothetical protein [Corynebacterium mendelii]MBN9644397.1 hypothetical protein [Corynebacterium mendelii]
MHDHPSPTPDSTDTASGTAAPTVLLNLARIARATVARCGLAVEDTVRIHRVTDPFDGVAVSVWDGPDNTHRYFYGVVKDLATQQIPHLLLCMGRTPSYGGSVAADGTPRPLDPYSRCVTERACRGHLRLVRHTTEGLVRLRHTPAADFIPVAEPDEDEPDRSWVGNGAEVDGVIMLNLFSYRFGRDVRDKLATRPHGEVMDVFRTAVSVAESVAAGCGRYSLHRDAALLHWGTDSWLQFYAGLMYRALARTTTGCSPLTVVYDGQEPNPAVIGCPAAGILPRADGDTDHVWSGKLQLALPRPIPTW